MNVVYKFEQALRTPLGDLLLFLIVSFVTVFFFTLFFWMKFRWKNDLLLYYRFFFKKAEKKITDVTFSGAGEGDFFGKTQTVEFTDGRLGKSLILYPFPNGDQFAKRYDDYHMALLRSREPHFPKTEYGIEEGMFYCIETPPLLSAGKTVMHFSDYCRDHAFSLKERELFLLDIAYLLDALHRVKTETGEELYHGFLLPSSFYVTVNLLKKITGIHIARHGLAYAMDASVFLSRREEILEKKCRISPSFERELRQFSFLLAPEQKEPGYAITPACDFYAFGALAVYLFTQKECEEVGKIDPRTLPAAWASFLLECLNPIPENRPTTFMELQELLENPENAFCFDEGFYPEEEGPSTHLQGTVGSAYEKVRKKYDPENIEFSPEWQEGYRAVKNKDWEMAGAVFNRMMKEDKQLFHAHLGLALTYYRQGIREKAKYHYLQAKLADEKKISCFYRLIAFDV